MLKYSVSSKRDRGTAAWERILLWDSDSYFVRQLDTRAQRGSRAEYPLLS